MKQIDSLHKDLKEDIDFFHKHQKEFMEIVENNIESLEGGLMSQSALKSII